MINDVQYNIFKDFLITRQQDYGYYLCTQETYTEQYYSTYYFTCYMSKTKPKKNNYNQYVFENYQSCNVNFVRNNSYSLDCAEHTGNISLKPNHSSQKLTFSNVDTYFIDPVKEYTSTTYISLSFIFIVAIIICIYFIHSLLSRK